MDGDRTAVGVLGAGAWGTALAFVLARNGHPVRLWSHDPAHVADMRSRGCNAAHFPQAPFPANLQPVERIADALADAAAVLVAVPSYAFRSTLVQAEPVLMAGTPLVWATKGLETGSAKLLHTVVDEVFFNSVTGAVISGPSFAAEVMAGQPTAVTLACGDSSVCTTLAQKFHNEFFRVYTCADVVGVELGGALKNVFAIAAGISDGMGFGANARAALITRAVAEMVRLGNAMGGRLETFVGLAGIGDLVLTCTDDQSRNRRLGLALGRGEALDAAAARIGTVEGVKTAREALDLACQRNIDMPITEQIVGVLFHGRSPQDAVHELLRRELKPEII